MADYILGIDVGTSTCKCCVIDLAGQVLCTLSKEYNALTGIDGTAEQDPRVWYSALVSVLKDIREKYDYLKDIIAVGTTGQMRGLTFIGHGGEIVYNSILWNDTRCQGEVQYIKKNNDGLMKEITFNPLNTMCTLPKILWVKKNINDVYTHTDKFIYPKDYINYKLTNVIATDPSDASGSSMFDFKNNIWSDTILDMYGIDKKRLPEIKSSFSVVGKVTRQAAGETGLNEGIPVVLGGSDSTVELYSLQILNDTKCKIRLGSSCGISIVIDDSRWNKDMAHYCWRHVTGKDIVLDINTRFCSQSVKWLRDVFYGELQKTGDTYQAIDRDAQQVPVGANGLIFHPYLQGEDAPYWNTRLRGMFHGIDSSHGRKEFARSVFEGTAFSIYDVMNTFSSVYGKCKTYVIIGGGTKSQCWLSIIVDMLGKEAIVPQNSDASFGASLIALKAVTNSDADLSKLLDETSIQYKPDKNNHERYKAVFDLYKSLVNCGFEYADRKQGNEQ